jgi:hypothetical protein
VLAASYVLGEMSAEESGLRGGLMPDGSPRQRAGQLAHRRTKWQALQAEDRVTQAIQAALDLSRASCRVADQPRWLTTVTSVRVCS